VDFEERVEGAEYGASSSYVGVAEDVSHPVSSLDRMKGADV
jgi:hypothetical protein